MHIGIVNLPSNFHTQKWALALKNAGAQVTIFSFEDYVYPEVECVKIAPNFTFRGRENYGSYLFSGKKLYDALKKHKVDVVNPINITPMGVWAYYSGFRPMASVAMGADILEYPPKMSDSPLLSNRAFTNSEGNKTFLRQMRDRFVYHFYKSQVKKSLQASDFITGDNLVLTNAVTDWFGIAKEKVHLNRWGIEEHLFSVSEARLQALREKFRIKKGRKVVLSPRGVMPIYQGDIILEGFAKMLEKGANDTHFIMFSAGYHVPEKVAKLAAELEAKYDNFYFYRGMIPRTEVYEIWSLVDIFVSAPIYDGYSNALGEGRYIGAIPVVNDIPATRETIVHQYNGWVTNPFNAENLAKDLFTILEDLEIWKNKFQKVNKEWILENSVLEKNIRIFLQQCEELTKR
jgi:glycosyltransferase involved in cell wall biosynthesis